MRPGKRAKKNVIFLAFDNKLGLTYHFVDWVRALEKKAGDKLKIIFVTLKNEQTAESGIA
jgi:hypothetical protein